MFVLDLVTPLMYDHSDLTDTLHPLRMHSPTALVFAGRIKVIKQLDPDIQVLAGNDEL